MFFLSEPTTDLYRFEDNKQTTNGTGCCMAIVRNGVRLLLSGAPNVAAVLAIAVVVVVVVVVV